MGGLVVGRRYGEAVVIGGDVTVRVLRSERGGCRLHIDAPAETAIVREELVDEGTPEFVWLAWSLFAADRAPRRAGELALEGLMVRKAIDKRAVGCVIGVETFPASSDPVVLVDFCDGSGGTGCRASHLEWKVSAR